MSPNAFEPEAETALSATTTLARAAILVLVALSKAGRGAKELGAPGGSVYNTRKIPYLKIAKS